MAGIYIHIPFCKQACNYCNFHFSTNKKNIPLLINCIEKEIELRKGEIHETIDTIYFGGGTPSIIDIHLIENIIAKIQQDFTVSSNVEITLEANPDDITEENLLQWKAIGINRFSLGVQSFIEDELKWMNRSHNADEAKKCIELVSKYFDNYSIDLIFGSQLLTTAQWINNIKTALSFNPPHLSCYALTIEDKTKLANEVFKKHLQNIDDKKQAEQFEILMQMLNNAGYIHYEISNYCKPSFESRHNSSYWQGKQYMGLGPSAHSYNGNIRSWNIANNSLYLQSIEKNILPTEVETLTQQQKFNEYIMIGIRNIKGIDIKFIEQNFDAGFLNEFNGKINSLLEQNLIAKNDLHITLTQQGKLFADAVAVELFM